MWRGEKWGVKLLSVALTLLALYFSSVLTGQAWCTRLTHTFAVVSVGENKAVVSAGLAVAGVALRQVLLDGPAEVQLLHAGTLNLLYQLWQRPQLHKHKHKPRDVLEVQLPWHSWKFLQSVVSRLDAARSFTQSYVEIQHPLRYLPLRPPHLLFCDLWKRSHGIRPVWVHFPVLVGIVEAHGLQSCDMLHAAPVHVHPRQVVPPPGSWLRKK